MLSEKQKDTLNALDILLEDLSEEQKSKLETAVDKIRNPNNMTPNEAQNFVKELSLDIEALQEKAMKLRSHEVRMHEVRSHEVRNEKTKIGRNETCLCGSGKKYKKCCLSRTGLVE